VDQRDRTRGCLLGGAVGDALGAPVEFSSLSEIRRRFGPRGVTGMIEASPAVTDDTQMTLFTAEGLIRASVRGRTKGICHPPSVVRHAYLRWLHTQGLSWEEARHGEFGDQPDGWLVGERRLHRRRAPGNTCLSALSTRQFGTCDEPLNDSKGCGGVMRVAPVGLFVPDPAESFALASELAALTHGHPSGWISAGAFGAMISCIVDGASVRDAVADGLSRARARRGHEETTAALHAAIDLACDGMPSPEALETLGGAWVGEEALAIGVCCALAAPDFRTGVLAAVNHSGDSDSTGAICGNLLGARYGIDDVPAEWIGAIDVADVVTQIADDLVRERVDPPSSGADDVPDDWWQRYPGW
jgi:ADP-ribosylglycohydrolase